MIKKFIAEECGTETLEWGLVCALIVIGSIAAIKSVGPKIQTLWNSVNGTIP